MEISNQDVRVRCSDGTEMNARLSKPVSPEPQPAIIVIHEAWGLNEQIKGVARRYAEQGFVALAPHLFTRNGDVMTEKNIESAMKLAWSIPPDRRNDPRAVEQVMTGMSEVEKKVVSFFFLGRDAFEKAALNDLLSCVEYLKSQSFVLHERLGVTGFCLGGGLTYQVSTMYPFGASVPFYGANPKPIESVAKITGPVLGIYAGEDERVNSGIPALVESMIKFKRAFEMKLYSGVQHAFFNETRPVYHKPSADDAWESAVRFFNRHLRA